jgi:Zn-dependent protease
MTFLIFALALTVMATPLLRSSQAAQGRITTSGFDGTGVIIGFAITAGVAAATSPLMGFGFVFAVLLHEFGAARACQIVGHDLARVRLVPLPYVAPPRTDHGFEDALEDSFAALYAPALAILPMVVCFGLFQASAPYFPAFSNFMRALGIMIGTFNFVMLLPFIPLPGGRVVRAVSDSFWPNLSAVVTLFMVAAFAAAALRDQSIAMGLMAIAGLQSLIRRKHPEQARLSPNNALVVLASYAFCMCVHFSGGWWLLRSLL